MNLYGTLTTSLPSRHFNLELITQPLHFLSFLSSVEHCTTIIGLHLLNIDNTNHLFKKKQ